MCFYGLFHRFDWLERNSGSTGLCPTPNVGPLSPPCCPQVARVLPSNCKATSHCAAFSQALMAALHAMVSWPWRVRWSNEKVFFKWFTGPQVSSGHMRNGTKLLLALPCGASRSKSAKHCAIPQPFRKHLSWCAWSVMTSEVWIAGHFLFPTLQLCGPAEPSWNVWNKVETCPFSALRLECWTSMEDLAPRASHVAELTQLK